MNNTPDYEQLYFQLVEALGYEKEHVISNELQDKSIEAAKILRRVAVAMQTSSPETSGALFICGIGGEKDDLGLPERLSVCPTYGMQGSATYTKTRDYSEPGW
jgi:hypothetical protein